MHFYDFLFNISLVFGKQHLEKQQCKVTVMLKSANIFEEFSKGYCVQQNLKRQKAVFTDIEVCTWFSSKSLTTVITLGTQS